MARSSARWAFPAAPFRKTWTSRMPVSPLSKLSPPALLCSFPLSSKKEHLMSKTILTTGAGSGFGKAAAIGMAKNGHNIIATTHVASQVTPLREEVKALSLRDFRVERLDLTDSYDMAYAQ